MGAEDSKTAQRRRMAWQLALGLSLAAGLVHIGSLRLLFLITGLAQVVGAAGMRSELRHGVRGWGSRVALVAACCGGAHHLLMLGLATIELANGQLQDAGLLLQSGLWGVVVDPLIVVALAWGSPDGHDAVRPRRQPGLV